MTSEFMTQVYSAFLWKDSFFQCKKRKEKIILRSKDEFNDEKEQVKKYRYLALKHEELDIVILVTYLKEYSQHIKTVYKFWWSHANGQDCRTFGLLTDGQINILIAKWSLLWKNI